jgi:branched-chain amino acid transport system substrate-binding protein
MRTAGALLAASCAFSLSAGAAHAQPLTVYSSLPLTGAARPVTLSIERGARLALEEAGGKAGAHSIRYVSLDDSTAQAGTWTPERTSRNARRAARDDSTIAYIGEFNSGASTISMPTLNEVGIPQISPSNAAVGLTRGGPGADRGEPDRYYPTGRRHYFRIAPNDRVQGAALAAAMRDGGCRRVAFLNDGEVYGAGVGVLARRNSRRLGLRVVHASRTRPRVPSFRRLARRVRRSRPHCVAYTGITANGAVQLFRDLARALPRAKLFGSDGVAESGFADPREGGVPRRVGRRVLITESVLAPEAYPAEGQAVLQRYASRYRERFPDPQALHGYEAMRLVLDGVAAVGPQRSALIDWLGSVRDRASVLGTYGFDPFGDTTLRDYGLYRIRNRALVWAGVVRAP